MIEIVMRLKLYEWLGPLLSLDQLLPEVRLDPVPAPSQNLCWRSEGDSRVQSDTDPGNIVAAIRDCGSGLASRNLVRRYGAILSPGTQVNLLKRKYTLQLPAEWADRVKHLPIIEFTQNF